MFHMNSFISAKDYFLSGRMSVVLLNHIMLGKRFIFPLRTESLQSVPVSQNIGLLPTHVSLPVPIATASPL